MLGKIVGEVYAAGPLKDCGIDTAVGCVPIQTQTELVRFIIGWAAGIIGGIGFLMILYASFLIITSAGDPKKTQAGRELLTSAISGILLMLLSVYLLKVVGVDILNIL